MDGSHTSPLAAPLSAEALGTTKMLARVEGAVGWMTFNNPARRNAVSLDMWKAIPRILGHFVQDPAIRVIAVTGAGDRAFVSGADISEFETVRSTPEDVMEYERIAGLASTALKEAGKPTVAVIRGWCIGGGLATALNCDLRFAADTAKFGVPAGRLGLGYAMPGVKTLVDLVGPSFAKEIFYTARHFSAAEALTMGLINRALPEAALDEFVAGQFETMAENAPMTLHTLKRTVAALAKGAPTDDKGIAQLVTDCFASADYREGRQAFMEKRKPRFTGT
jgi:enoyl-CoA hydratase